MTIDGIKDFLVYVFSIITCAGVPILIYFIYTKNNKEKEIIKKFTDETIYKELDDYKTEKIELSNKLKQYVEMLEVEIYHTSKEKVNQRMELLQKLIDQNLVYKEFAITQMQTASEQNETFSQIFLVTAYSLVSHIEFTEQKLKELISLEKSKFDE